MLLDTLSHGQRLLTVSDYIASPAFKQMLQMRQATDDVASVWPAQVSHRTRSPNASFSQPR